MVNESVRYGYVKYAPRRSRYFRRQSAILGIVWLAVATRLVYLAYVNEMPQDGLLFGPLCGVDAHIYDQYGQELLVGKWPGSAPLFRTPLYTIYLGLVFQLTAINHYTPLIFQALIHAVAVAALYRVGCLVFSRTAGLLAALGYVSYGSAIYYVACFAQVSLVLPALIIVLFLLLKFQLDEYRLWLLILAGLLLGLAGLGRPTVLVLVPAVLIWFALNRGPGRGWAKHAAIFVMAVLLPVIPVTFFNYAVSGRFIPVSANGPEVLFISNNLEAEGRDILAPGIAQPVHQRMERVVAGIERNETTFAKEVVDYIMTEPLDWAALEFNKLWLLFGKLDLNLLTIAFSYSTTARQIDIFEVTPVRWHGVLVAAFLGMILIRRPQSPLLLLFFLFITLATLVFFVQLRFRLLLIPVVLLYAAALLAAAPGWFRSARLIYFAVLIILIGFIPFYGDLWPFALIFLGIGLWQATRLILWSQVLWPLLACWSLFITLMLAAQITSSVYRLGQFEDYFQGPEIMGNRWLGQTFRPNCDGLSSFRLTLGLPHKVQDQPIFFHLRSLDDGREIFIDQFSAHHLTDRAMLDFTFPPQADSSQNTYVALLSSPASSPGNSITIRGFSDLPADWYPDGTAVLGEGAQLQPFPGDLAFAASCNNSLLQTINITFERLPGRPWFYWVLLIGNVGLLAVAGWKSMQTVRWSKFN